MTLKKIHKALPIVMLALLVLQLPWYAVVQAYANKTLVKTTATVIRIDRRPANCYIRSTTCDRSDHLYPVYEYFDQSGTRYEQDDQYFGEYKQNSPLAFLRKDVGDKVPAYYTKDKPQEVDFMASIYAYTAWLVPLYLVLFILAPLYGLGCFVRWYRRRTRTSHTTNMRAS